MKVRNLKSIATPYDGILSADYEIEKRRLQLELLKIQQEIIDKAFSIKKALAIAISIN